MSWDMYLSSAEGTRTRVFCSCRKDEAISRSRRFLNSSNGIPGVTTQNQNHDIVEIIHSLTTQRQRIMQRSVYIILRRCIDTTHTLRTHTHTHTHTHSLTHDVAQTHIHGKRYFVTQDSWRKLTKEVRSCFLTKWEWEKDRGWPSLWIPTGEWEKGLGNDQLCALAEAEESKEGQSEEK